MKLPGCRWRFNRVCRWQRARKWSVMLMQVALGSRVKTTATTLARGLASTSTPLRKNGRPTIACTPTSPKRLVTTLVLSLSRCTLYHTRPVFSFSQTRLGSFLSQHFCIWFLLCPQVSTWSQKHWEAQKVVALPHSSNLCFPLKMIVCCWMVSFCFLFISVACFDQRKFPHNARETVNLRSQVNWCGPTVWI